MSIDWKQSIRLPDGRVLSFLSCGDPQGKPVACLHGFPGSRLDFAGFDRLASRYRLRLLSLDRPGYGGSSPLEGRTLAGYCRDVEALLVALGIKCCAVYGVSGGGPYALACASGLPHLVCSAVCVGGLGEMTEEGATDGMGPSNKSLFLLAESYPRLAELSLKGTAWLMTRRPGLYYRMLRRVLPAPDKHSMEGIRPSDSERMRKENVEVFCQGTRWAAQEAALYTRPWDFDPAGITIPVHIWHGEQDKNVPIGMARRLVKKIPGAVPHFLQGEGHMIAVRHAGEIFAALAGSFPGPAVDTQKHGGYNEFNQKQEDDTMKEYHINTKCVQSGYTPKNGEPRVVPIVQSTTFKYEKSADMGALFDLEADGFFYTRLANPTLDAAEKKIADLEGGVAAMVTSAGQAATLMSITNICHAGGHVVCASAVYGGTFNLINATLRDLGISVTFVPPMVSEEELNAAFQENTRCAFVESLANPALVVADLELFAKAAHAHGVPLIVDNTFPTPVNCRPFDFGADIVVHSTSKYMDGHAVALGGVIVDGGRFDWNNGKFPELTEPDETYHGVRFTEHFGAAAYIARARLCLMRDFGAQMAPQNAFLLNLGLETLSLRMERHCSNALAVAKFLEQSDKVESVSYPGLESSPYYELAQKYMPKGTCGVISFTVKGGRPAAEKMMAALKLAAIVTHVADTRTCVLHPASSTHRQLSDEQLVAAGIGSGLIRLSVGIEYVDDIIADLEQALAII